MSNTWPPPSGEPNPDPWGQQPAPQQPAPQQPAPQQPAPQQPAPQQPWQQQPAWPAPPELPNSWPAPQQPQQPWQQQQPYGAFQYYEPGHKTTGDRALEWAVPINRSGLAIAAGYVALLSFPILVAAPFGVLLGALALRDISAHPTRLGRGRAWFAIIYGGLGTIALGALIMTFLAR